jgi:hypothetical protein
MNDFLPRKYQVFRPLGFRMQGDFIKTAKRSDIRGSQE